LTSNNFYAEYSQSSLLGASPIRLIVALYEGATEAVQQARECLVSGDVWARSRAISKAVNILTELMCSLDHQKGGEISANFKRLYSYMQQRLLLAHSTKAAEPMIEVEKLLRDLLESWRTVSAQPTEPESDSCAVIEPELVCEPEPRKECVYDSYFTETPGSVLGESLSF
jgi:flagellar secretion chaperone FliS